MTSSRCVLDTNVFVSAALFRRSKLARVFREVLKTGNLLVSLKTLEELRDVLNCKKFDRYITSKDKRDILALVIRRSTLIDPSIEITVCRDPKDKMILELAVSGEANFIITGDEDLLILNPFQSIQILTPDAWLMCFRKS
ncbi:MAG: putative toxin-antitoxin system toxin component, PIN family [Leptolyngbyaceae cyanobacterium T60_A2020_046]|nr:putative toxin-antitoxin system toxin component, PIN family [Leptolyngbyaceae cyanobacterium T60_A2020_046]